jgi:vanillate O-demethylase ferredoxin subunit
MTDLHLIVSTRTQEADGICSFELEPALGGELPPFTAGAHIDVHLHPGIVRQYSLCGDPAERRRWRIAVLREPRSRGGSSGMHEEVHPGTALRVSEPRNHFPLDAEAVLSGAHGETHLYVCGPAGFMDHVLAAARRLGWAEDRLHREYFAAPVAPTPAADSAFDVRLARSGIALSIPPNKSVLQVLLGAGIDIPYSCESGVCGTCATLVLDGAPDHRDAYFTDAERAKGDRFTPCCSRSTTPVLVLDL